jgi:hypothetical protein
MVTRILLAAILCLIPAYAAAQTDTGPGRDIAAIHHLIEQYAKAVDTVDLNLISQIWSHSPEVSFIYPLGEEHGFDAIEQQVFQHIMGGMFSSRDLETHGVAIHVNGNAGWSEFHWIFHATMRKEHSAHAASPVPEICENVIFILHARVARVPALGVAPLRWLVR